MAGTTDDGKLIIPDWPAPAGVRAVATTRAGGHSVGPFAGLNLGDHVGDVPATVTANRARLRALLALPDEPLWLRQVHGTRVARASAPAPAGSRAPEADGAWTDSPGRACAVLTADCLPLLLCNRQGTHVAAVHAGWRGLAAGVIEATVDALGTEGVAAVDLLAWLGPAIGPGAYEIGGDVRAAFLGADPGGTDVFRASRPGHWFLDLYAAARRRLGARGVTAVSGGTHCTCSEPDRFFSHRRDGVCGRQATLIWLEADP